MFAARTSAAGSARSSDALNGEGESAGFCIGAPKLSISACASASSAMSLEGFAVLQACTHSCFAACERAGSGCVLFCVVVSVS